VVAGDTLYGIAKRYGVTIGDIQRLNDLGDSGLIRPGQRLRVR
jgi:LysM repeat protein